MSIMNICHHCIMITVLLHIRCSLTTDPGNFDYYKLVLQWPGTVCNANAVNCPNLWTIHGLWPAFDDKSKKDPQECSKVLYNEQEIKVKKVQKGRNVNNLTGVKLIIMDDMKSYWPDLQKDNNNNFWKHEWERHGTCSNLTIQEYFNMTIDLAKKHDIKSYLMNKNIVPGNDSYSAGNISNAILDSVKFSPALRKKCKKEGNFLQEIFICYTKEFALRNCKDGDSNVKNNVSLSYPPIPNQQLAAALYQGDEDTCDDASSDSTRCVHFRWVYPIVLALVVYCYNYNWK